MKLEIIEDEDSVKPSVHEILDYGTFSSQHRKLENDNELRTFEKFNAALNLMSSGLETFIDPTITIDSRKTSVKVDVAAVDPDTGKITVVFCHTSPPSNSFWSILKNVVESDNGQAIILSPGILDKSTIEEHVPKAIRAGKVKLQNIGWFSDSLEAPMLDTLRMLELLVNETRIRMLAPLFQKTMARKKEYRSKINPKLVYSNLNSLSQAGLLNETAAEEGAYELSNFGKAMLGEFLTFLEKTRRILDESRQEEIGGAK